MPRNMTPCRQRAKWGKAVVAAIVAGLLAVAAGAGTASAGGGIAVTPVPATPTPAPTEVPAEAATPAPEATPSPEVSPTPVPVQAISVTPAPEATPSPEVSPTPVPLQITSVTSPVRPGQDATLTARTDPFTECTITVTYRTGPSTAAGLEPKTADADGNVSWTWMVGTRTTPGTWPIVVTASVGGVTTTVETTFVVQASTGMRGMLEGLAAMLHIGGAAP